MCSTNATSSTIIPFGMKLGTQSPYLPINSPHLGLELQRAQLQEYSQRLQLGLRSFPGQMSSLNALSYHGHLANPYIHPYFYKDPRARFIHEEPKPNHSYIGLIAMAILSSRDKKLVLSDIYQWILDNYNYFRTRGPGWRNSIRHNLSLNDCFIKSGRSANGKGHYWAIHPANVDDFMKGDFRRRRAQRRVRKHMGLSVPDDDDDDDSPAPSPVTTHAPQPLHLEVERVIDCTKDSGPEESDHIECHSPGSDDRSMMLNVSGQSENNTPISPAKRPKRLFDMDSILAPDDDAGKRHDNEGTRTITMDSANTLDDSGSIKAGNYSESDAETADNKRHAVDLTLSRETLDDDRHIKRPFVGLNASDPTLGKLSAVHPAVFTGSKTLPYVPQFISGLHRGADLQQRVSAFRNASAYSWASLSGYLSNYQLMALGGQHPAVIQRSPVDGESAWQRSVTGLGSQGSIPTREHSPHSQTTDE